MLRKLHRSRFPLRRRLRRMQPGRADSQRGIEKQHTSAGSSLTQKDR